jgi:integrase
VGELTAKGVAALKAPGRYSDGDGLYLVIDSGGRRYWFLRYMLNGRRRDMSIGPERRVSLAAARAEAMKARLSLLQGIDPLAARETRTKAGISFEEAARRVHKTRSGGWRNGKHQDQWITTLENHVFPRIGNKPVAQVTRGDVVELLEPIWLEIPETARRVKQRIGNVIDWAVGAGIREHGIEMKLVERALPRHSAGLNHFAAVKAADMPAFIQALALSTPGPVVRAAIELMILTASRPGNIRFLTWDQIALETKVWTRPAKLMKNGRVHRVPLPRRAVDLLGAIQPEHAGDTPVFPGLQGRPLSENTLNKAVKSTGFEATSHGFRTSFKEWSLANGWPDHLSEMQLAHTDQNKARAAYAREDLLEERRPMMEAWANYLYGGRVLR